MEITFSETAKDKLLKLMNEKGLTDEYDKLSKELSEQMELATMYALNEW